MEPGALLLVHFIEPQPLGYAFERSRSSWPLHITLVPWFYVTQEKMDVFSGLIETYAQTFTKFQVEVGKSAMFGPKNDVPVNVIVAQEPINKLHIALLQFVVKSGGRPCPQEQHWVEENYQAHITQHGNNGRSDGDVEDIDAVTLVRLLEGNRCEVVKDLKLGDGNA